MEIQSSCKEKNVQGAGAQTTKLFLPDGIGFVEMLEYFGNDLTVVNAARVSFHKEVFFEQVKECDEEGQEKIIGTKLSKRDSDLIVYLAANQHIAPFFHPQVRFRLKMPVFVAREWFRHTVGFARNEVSRRYVTEEPQCFVPEILRKRDANVKQGSKADPVENHDAIHNGMKQYMFDACAYYNHLLEQGVCPEHARMVLPQSMYTEFIETASLAAYARLAGLRLDPAAQREIQSYAQLVSTCMKDIFPVSWVALTKGL